ncbi:MAG: hypothetical protein AAFX01_04405 [Cyanobacteria bacterium J06638_28]
MKTICESPLAFSLLQMLPERLQRHSYSILELAQELAQEFECPLCEILTPVSEALVELEAHHQIQFDNQRKQILLA